MNSWIGTPGGAVRGDEIIVIVLVSLMANAAALVLPSIWCEGLAGLPLIGSRIGATGGKAARVLGSDRSAINFLQHTHTMRHVGSGDSDVSETAPRQHRGAGARPQHCPA